MPICCSCCVWASVCVHQLSQHPSADGQIARRAPARRA
jgi:hypothetical protein